MVLAAVLGAWLSKSETTSSEGLEPLQLVGPAVAYQARGYAPGSEDDPGLSAQIAQDLRLLRGVGFRGLVTYGADGALASIPEIARREGFDGTIVMGVWDPLSGIELERAVTASKHVDGYAVGNEGLGLRYDVEDLAGAMNFLRGATGLPVTTTEPIDSYLTGPYREWLLANSDWLFPLAHPYWAVHFEPKRAVDWVIARHDYLVATTGRRVMLKEAGFPTWCDEMCSEEQQIMLFSNLEVAEIPFFYFEAFDQPWKTDVLKFGPVEAYWGLFDFEGNAKAVVAWLQQRIDQ